MMDKGFGGLTGVARDVDDVGFGGGRRRLWWSGRRCGGCGRLNLRFDGRG